MAAHVEAQHQYLRVLEGCVPAPDLQLFTERVTSCQQRRHRGHRIGQRPARLSPADSSDTSGSDNDSGGDTDEHPHR